MARSLALGIVPMLSQHENLLRHISHQHWELSSQNRDIHSDPHFCILVSRQRSNEVALFQEEMVTDTLRFCNLMAKVLSSQLSDDRLTQMPEHFVDNVCDILMSVAKLKPKLLRSMELRFVFQLVVKLLSPTYASVSSSCRLVVVVLYCTVLQTVREATPVSYIILTHESHTISLLPYYIIFDRWFATTIFVPC
jgi:hypothetical protein